MTIDKSDATAIVFTEGISLSCITDNNECQIAFIRPPAPHIHELKLEVERKIGDSSAGKLDTKDIDLSPGAQLVLEVVNPAFEKCDLHLPSESFDRLSSTTDEQDYRWVVDMNKDVQEGIGVNLKGQARNPLEAQVTLLTVNNALFYTESRTGFEVIKIREGETPDPNNRFGELGRKVGGLIKCMPGPNSGVRLRNVGKENGIFLEREENVRYEISFTNLPQGTHAHGETQPDHEHDETERETPEDTGSDFPMVYKLLFPTSGPRFDFRKFPPDEGESLNRVCEGIRLSSLDNLASLTAGEARGAGGD